MNKKNAQDYPYIELRSVESIADTAAEEPLNGVYLVARTYNHGRSVLNLDAHFDRLERSAAGLGYPVTAPRRKIRETLAADIRRRSAPLDIRFRVTAILEDPVRYLVTTEEARDIDPELRRLGVVCAVVRNAARKQAAVKSTAWMHRRLQMHRDAIAQPPYEHLLTDGKERILEGAASNFYAVVDGTLRTAGDGVLEGIARAMVLAVAPDILPVSMTPVTLDDVLSRRLQEAFISSATRGIVPVRQIDQVILGPPGPVTRAVAVAWNRLLEETLTPLLT
ncbi:MAG: aminotransferase class IV [Alkalispirochaeta sp.]